MSSQILWPAARSGARLGYGWAGSCVRLSRLLSAGTFPRITSSAAGPSASGSGRPPRPGSTRGGPPFERAASAGCRGIHGSKPERNDLALGEERIGYRCSTVYPLHRIQARFRGSLRARLRLNHVTAVTRQTWGLVKQRVEGAGCAHTLRQEGLLQAECLPVTFWPRNGIYE